MKLTSLKYPKTIEIELRTELGNISLMSLYFDHSHFCFACVFIYIKYLIGDEDCNDNDIGIS